MRTHPLTHLLFLFVAGIVSLHTAGATDILVVNNNDSGAGSLRQALASNATLGGGNTIVFSNSVTGTITLGSELLISNGVSITGPGQNVLAITGNNATRIFHLTNSVTSVISGLTLANGENGTKGGAILQDSGSLTLIGCTVTASAASGNGGGMEADGSLTASNCTFSANTCEVSGGAIYATAALTLDACTFSQNTLGFVGGGGGVNYLGPQGIIRNCTFSGNQGPGGGLFNSGTMTVTNCTFSGNSGTGGGIDNGGTITVRNTIIAGNTGATDPDCKGTFISAGFNFIGKTDGSTGWGATGDQTGTVASPINPQLGPLQNNGGLTMTMALFFGSPALDKGNSSGIAVDQRGAPRPFDFSSIANASGGDGSDIGAFEFGSPLMSIQRVGGNAVLSWPAFYGGFHLQSSAALGSSANWTAEPGIPVVVGNQFTLTNGPAAGNKFYRLTFP